jgi:hypothetical protein
MELLQKIKLNNLVVNSRYTISKDIKDNSYWFTVLEIDDDRIRIKYYDKTIGILYSSYIYDVFNLPFSSLEKELL